MTECIFCKIVAGLVPATVVWSNEKFIAFYDIHPKAKIHVLIIPKHHIESLNHITDADSDWLGDYFLAIQEVAKALNLSHYQLRFHNGAGSGQEVFHLHAHLLQH